PRYNLPQRRRELPRLLGADESRERLLKESSEERRVGRGDGVVGLQDLPLKIGNEHGVGRVLDQALGVGPGLVELTHVTQDADNTYDLAVRVTQRRSVKGRGDDLPARAPGVEPGVARDAPRYNLPQRRRELPCLLGADESRERLLKE